MFRVIFLVVLLFINSFALQSTITTAEGIACMGDDKSRKQTRTEAIENAKRNALERVFNYIKTETFVKNFELQKDVINSYSNGQVKLIEILNKEWYKDNHSGECFKVQIKAEVIPEKIKKIQDTDDPTAPLSVKLWTDKKEYKKGEKINIYFKGNKPFYAVLLYKDVKGNIIQILPNPHRKDNYFQGGTIYKVPSGEDIFEIEVSPPFGEEKIILYASTKPIGEIDLEDADSVYIVKNSENEISTKTRSIKIKRKENSTNKEIGEFFQIEKEIQTKEK